jgi:hypothetical protein
MDASAREQFERDGFVVLPSIFSDVELNELKTEMAHIVDEMNVDDHPLSIFTTYDEKKASLR